MKELIDFIELLLADGILDENERALIFRRADQLNVSEADCSIIINSLISKHQNSKGFGASTSKKREFKTKEIINIEPEKFGMEDSLQKEIENDWKVIEDLYKAMGDESKMLDQILPGVKKEFFEAKLLVENENREIENEYGRLSKIHAKLDSKLESYFISLKQNFEDRTIFNVNFNKNLFYNYLNSRPFPNALFKSMYYTINDSALEKAIKKTFNIYVYGIYLPFFLILFTVLNLEWIISIIVIIVFLLFSISAYDNYKDGQLNNYKNEQFLKNIALKKFSKLIKANPFNEQERELLEKTKGQVPKLTKIDIDDINKDIQEAEPYAKLWEITDKIPSQISKENEFPLYKIAAKEIDDAIPGPERTVEDFIKKANIWKELFGETEKARMCLEEAERIAKDVIDWRWLAATWKELLADTEKVRMCLEKAERIAKESDDWSDLAASWKELLGDLKKEQECLEKSKLY